MVLMTLSLCPRNEHHRSVNIFRPCIFGNNRATQPHWSTIVQSAAFLVQNACDSIVTMSWYERQQSVNNFRPCILDNQGAVPWHYSIIGLRTAFLSIMLSTTSQLCPENERHRSVNHFRPSIFENNGAVQQHSSIMIQSAASLGKNACHNIVTRF